MYTLSMDSAEFKQCLQIHGLDDSNDTNETDSGPSDFDEAYYRDRVSPEIDFTNTVIIRAQSESVATKQLQTKKGSSNSNVTDNFYGTKSTIESGRRMEEKPENHVAGIHGQKRTYASVVTKCNTKKKSYVRDRINVQNNVNAKEDEPFVRNENQDFPQLHRPQHGYSTDQNDEIDAALNNGNESVPVHSKALPNIQSNLCRGAEPGPRNLGAVPKTKRRHPRSKHRGPNRFHSEDYSTDDVLHHSENHMPLDGCTETENPNFNEETPVSVSQSEPKEVSINLQDDATDEPEDNEKSQCKTIFGCLCWPISILLRVLFCCLTFLFL